MIDCSKCTDILKLSGNSAMEAIHDVVQTGRLIKFGHLTVNRVMSVGIDNETNRVVVGARLETGQSLMFSFDPHEEPTIEPHFQIIGTMQTADSDT